MLGTFQRTKKAHVRVNPAWVVASFGVVSGLSLQAIYRVTVVNSLCCGLGFVFLRLWC